MLLDTRTMIFALASGSLIMAVGLLIVNVRGARMHAMTLWVIASFSLFAAWTLYGLRGLVPLWISVAVAFAALSAGYALQFVSLAVLAERRVRYGLVAALTLGGIVAHSLLYAGFPADERARIVLSSCIAASWLFACGVVLLVGTSREERTSHLLTSGFFLILGVADAVRGVGTMLYESPVISLFSATPLQTVAVIVNYVAMFGTSLGFILMTKERADNQLLRVASVDPLTGLLTRRTFVEAALLELSRAQRQHLRTSLLMLDLDLFKRVNDTYGHPAGDAVLANFARALRTSVRPFDIVGRYGGEEFCVVLPGTALDEAVVIAERIRTIASNTPTEWRGATIATTVSIGVVQAPDATVTLDELVEQADRALYLAKAEGRNCVRVFRG